MKKIVVVVVLVLAVAAVCLFFVNDKKAPVSRHLVVVKEKQMPAVKPAEEKTVKVVPKPISGQEVGAQKGVLIKTAVNIGFKDDDGGVGQKQNQ